MVRTVCILCIRSYYTYIVLLPALCVLLLLASIRCFFFSFSLKFLRAKFRLLYASAFYLLDKCVTSKQKRAKQSIFNGFFMPAHPFGIVETIINLSIR